MIKHWWNEFLAWLRGDYADIVKGFQKVEKKLSAHQSYTRTKANRQVATVARLTEAARVNYDAADRASRVRSKIAELLA